MNIRTQSRNKAAVIIGNVSTMSSLINVSLLAFTTISPWLIMAAATAIFIVSMIALVKVAPEMWQPGI